MRYKRLGEYFFDKQEFIFSTVIEFFFCSDRNDFFPDPDPYPDPVKVSNATSFECDRIRIHNTAKNPQNTGRI